MAQIGRIERVDLRQIWRREAADFTTWLAKNIDYLSEAVGFDITVTKIEENVGPYRVDIYGEDGDGNKVIIENQLEKTDHGHLGQLLTYSVNLEAKTAIWVSPNPVEEHQHVIEWLNEITPDDVNFYLVQVEGLRMKGEETVAPLFTVIEGPSVERKQIGKERKADAERHTMLREFWAQFIQAMNARSALAQNWSPTKENWIQLALGVSGVSVNLLAYGDHARVEVYFNRGQQARNKEAFDALASHREAIERDLGVPLQWQRLDEKVTCRIRWDKDGVDVYDKSQWPAINEFLIDAGLRMHRVFKEYAQQIGRNA